MNATSTDLAGASTREQILRVARELIQTRSYLGFSFQDVANAIGIRKPSLYHHFPTKEALGIEVLREAMQAFKDWTVAKERLPQAALDAYFCMYRNGLHAGEGVCPAGRLRPAGIASTTSCGRRCATCAARRCFGSPACSGRWPRAASRRHRSASWPPMYLPSARARCWPRA